MRWASLSTVPQWIEVQLAKPRDITAFAVVTYQAKTGNDTAAVWGVKNYTIDAWDPTAPKWQTIVEENKDRTMKNRVHRFDNAAVNWTANRAWIVCRLAVDGECVFRRTFAMRKAVLLGLVSLCCFSPRPLPGADDGARLRVWGSATPHTWAVPRGTRRAKIIVYRDGSVLVNASASRPRPLCRLKCQPN